eukprot:CAMPEP_0117458324 /NCGR_PEP_ID=MMETSP0784-20121206/872_1 /TAXON_ID=39447 /ORGANISM="" /LENGTH=326 /DNA_ID=CAMNT_0005251839 /DNA_START=82 /DNA_END=1059 /DNA_ORIENTATION=-
MTHDQRKLLLLVAMLAFLLTQIEYLFGFAALNVHAVANSVHAMLHVAGLAVSFFAIGVSSQPKDEAFSYGYERVETLAAFTNCCFVIFECTFSCVHRLHDAIIRTMDGPLGNQCGHGSGGGARSDLVVRIRYCRLAVNLLGLILLASDARTSLHRSLRKRSQALPPHAENMADENLREILDDVIEAATDCTPAELPLAFACSTILVYLALPSLLVAGQILLLAVPADLQAQLASCRHEIQSLDGVTDVLRWNFWALTGASSLVGTVSVSARMDADGAAISAACHSICAGICVDLTLQIEYEQQVLPVDDAAEALSFPPPPPPPPPP